MYSVSPCPASHSLFVKFKTGSNKSKADRGGEAERKLLFLPFENSVFHHLTASKSIFSCLGFISFHKEKPS